MKPTQSTSIGKLCIHCRRKPRMKGNPPRPLWCDSCWKAGQHRAWQAGKRPFYENEPFRDLDVSAYAVRVLKWIKSKQ